MARHLDESARAHVADLLLDLGARAAGFWWIAGTTLEQVAFVASPTLPMEVAQGFAEATRSVPLTQAGLGIVRTAVEGTVTVSRALELPADSGSGFWLRAFGAERSVAVPLHDSHGALKAVVSAALPEDPRDDQAVANRMLETARKWGWLV